MAWSGVLESKACALADRQYGVVTRAQLHELGISRRTIARRLRAKVWRTLYPGVVRLLEAKHSAWRQQLMAVLLWLGDDAAVSHHAAARLWEMDGEEDEPIEVSTTRPRNGKPPVGITIHRVRELGRGEVTVVDGLRVTQPARTLADLSATVSEDRLDSLIDSVLRAKRTTQKALNAFVAYTRRRFIGCAKFRAVMDARGDGGPKDSEAERLFLKNVVEPFGLPRPEHNYRVRDADGTVVAKADFAYPKLRLVIEIYSRRHHTGDGTVIHDTQRMNRITGCNHQSLVFWWDDLTQTPADTAALLLETIQRRQQELGVLL